jgi:hypothetical protein
MAGLIYYYIWDYSYGPSETSCAVCNEMILASNLWTSWLVNLFKSLVTGPYRVRVHCLEDPICFFVKTAMLFFFFFHKWMRTHVDRYHV